MSAVSGRSDLQGVPPLVAGGPTDLLAHTTRVTLELSNRCNLAPAHGRCPAHLAGVPEILAADVVHDVLDALAQRGFGAGRYLAFHLYNEPLLDPRLVEFIGYARKRCPAAGIILWSNGWYLTATLLAELVAAGATHLMLSAYSDADEARFRDLGEGLRRRLATHPPLLPIYYAVRRQRELDERLTMTAPQPQADRRPCHEPLDDLTIRAGGELGLCCYDWARRAVFGNLNEQPFEACLASAFAAMHELQRELVRGERRLDVCRACLYPRRPVAERVAYTWPPQTLVSPAVDRTPGDATPAGPWARRRTLRYYRIVRQLLDELGPGELLVDVGSGDTPVATYGSFARRLAIDPQRLPDDPAIEGLAVRWQDAALERPATVITCLQVLEHLSDDELQPFARRLLASAATVIVSIPYRWPAGQDEEHRRDPMDEAALRAIMGREPLESIVVTERPNRTTHRRLIAVYAGDAAAPDPSPVPSLPSPSVSEQPACADA